MTKSDRLLIFNKYSGRCAYCGCVLEKGWCVDHIQPIYRGHPKGSKYITKGAYSIDNMNPSCRRCNLWKSCHSLENFRYEISEQTKRLKNTSSNFRLALDYGLLSTTQNDVIFYFEKHKF